MIRRAPATVTILAIIAAVFAYEVFAGALDNEFALARLGAITPDLLVRGEYWRLLSAMFLHANWWHVGANGWALYQLGTLYETLFGTRRFVLTYFASGICASIASVLFSHTIAVGASGAVFGILGAFIFSLLRSPQYRHQRWTRSLVSQMMFWILVNIVIGFSVTFIDNAAHLGGLVIGLLLGFLPHRVPPPSPGSMVIDLAPPPPPRDPYLQTLAAPKNEPQVLGAEDPFVDDGNRPPQRR